MTSPIDLVQKGNVFFFSQGNEMVHKTRTMEAFNIMINQKNNSRIQIRRTYT